MIYSYSKRLLFEYINLLPNKSEDVIHIETDSVYFNRNNGDDFKDNVVKYDKVKCKKGNGLVRWEGSCAHLVPDASMRDWEKGSDLQSCVQNPHPWSMISRNSESITLDGSHCRLGGSSHNGCRWWLKGSHHWLGGSRRFKGTNKHSMGMVGRIRLAQWEPSSA